MGLLRRRPRPQCYYCLSQSPEGTAGAATRWHCAACGCWNILDRSGNIVSENPAMRDSAMNRKSFSLRALPDNTRLRPVTSASPFCRECQTNQTLVMNLLSNYLPDESDPSYPALNDNLPAYIESLHARYPPVCKSCQPGVDDALRRADQRAQAEAWGRALKRGVDITERHSGPGWYDVAVWRVRGVAWCMDALGVAAIGVAAWLRPTRLQCKDCPGWKTAIIASRVMAILWAAWDPTWLRRARSAGLARAPGRRPWLSFMLAIYFARLAMASVFAVWSGLPRWFPLLSFLDLTTLLFALTQIRVAEPVTLTLVRPVPVTPSQSQHDPPPLPEPSLQTLSLNNVTPIRVPPNPVFGQTSMQTPQRVDEPMEWEATGPEREDWDSFGAGQQRMFERTSNETGLESLLASWGIGSTPPGGVSEHPNHIPQVRPATQPRPVLSDKAVRNTRVALLVVRLVALIAGVGRFLRVLGDRLDYRHMVKAQQCLLGLEGGASALALVVALATGRVRAPLAAVVLGCDAAVRIAALVAPPMSGMPQALVLHATPEILCAAWAALDAFVLAAT